LRMKETKETAKKREIRAQKNRIRFSSKNGAPEKKEVLLANSFRNIADIGIMCASPAVQAS